MTSNFGRKVLSLSQGSFGLNLSSRNKENVSSNSSKSLESTTIWCSDNGFRHKDFRCYKAS